MLENTAKQRIEFISNFMEDPEGLCKEDWEVWRPLIARSCAVVNEELRNKGLKTIHFFNIYFSNKKKQTLDLILT